MTFFYHVPPIFKVQNWNWNCTLTTVVKQDGETVFLCIKKKKKGGTVQIQKEEVSSWFKGQKRGGVVVGERSFKLGLSQHQHTLCPSCRSGVRGVCPES